MRYYDTLLAQRLDQKMTKDQIKHAMMRRRLAD
jgi:hypothetical protein